MIGHLRQCEGCAREWALYERLFQAVASLDEEPVMPAFVAPREAPGALDRSPTRPSLLDWRRVRVAASIVFLLAVSHVAVFEFARGGGQDEAFPALRTGAPSSSVVGDVSQPPLRPVSAGSTAVKRRLNDHVDAANLLARQIVYLPDDAGEEARALVSAQLRALQTDDLRRDVMAHEHELVDLAPTARMYLDTWSGLSEGLRDDMAIAPAVSLVGAMRDRVSNSNFVRSLRLVQMTVGTEPAGLTWREPAMASRMFNLSALDVDPAIKAYLAAHESLLSARYLAAARAFEGFGREHPESRLLALSRYLQAESYRRVGFADDALQVASHLSFRAPSMEFLRNDPLGMLVAVARRSLPVDAVQHGVPSAPHLNHGGAAGGGHVIRWFFDVNPDRSLKPAGRVSIRRFVAPGSGETRPGSTIKR